MKIHGMLLDKNEADIIEWSLKEVCRHFDFIYVMDSSNYTDVKQISGKLWREEKVDLLLNELYPGENRNVPDPWFGNEDGYYKVYEMIEKACDKILQKYEAGGTM